VIQPSTEDVVRLEYYERSDAETALTGLRRVVELVGLALERNGTPVEQVE
jgi:hypothetical protein